MSEQDWTFDEWFAAQHGKRPSLEQEHELRSELELSEQRTNSLRILLRQVEEWESRRASALYAWQIKDGQKR